LIQPFNGVPDRDSAAWAEMLARVALGNDRLGAVVRRSAKRTAGRKTVVEELERERGRIARELHAGAGQPLAGMALNLDLLEGCCGSLPMEARNALLRMRQLTEAALGQVRAVSHRLHPPDWQQLTIEAALRRLVTQTGLATRCETLVEIAPLPTEPPHSVKVTLYRCAQECISNVLRHSAATRFHLRLAMRGRWLELRITDNGKGFSSSSGAPPGIGLQSIQEHAKVVNGVVYIKSGPGGTTITVAVPFTEE